MPITQEQIRQFYEHPIPPEIKLHREDNSQKQVLRGKEALISKAFDEEGNTWAFKWYASLSGRKMDVLRRYADGINRDEASLQRLGLTSHQVPNSNFFICRDYVGNTAAELFALQPWTDGVPLREIPAKELATNRELRKNLGEFFNLCGQLYSKEGITPDLTGGKRLNLLGHDVVDPTGFIWPFRTTNVIINDNRPILVDAKHNNLEVHPIKKLAVLAHWRISQLTGQILIRF